ncbi:MAG: hypothetical protein WC346_04370 [Methanogenium sp.]|jgi:hypothetical protein
MIYKKYNRQNQEKENNLKSDFKSYFTTEGISDLMDKLVDKLNFRYSKK